MKKSKVGALFFYLIFVISMLWVSCTGSMTPVQTEPEQPVEVTFTVTYKTDYGTLPDMLKNGLKVKENTVLTDEQLPILVAADGENVVFKGWYEGQTKVSGSEYTVTKNVTLIALWGSEATVSYSSIFGTVPQSFEAELNTKLLQEKLTAVSCSPYTFMGWFYSKDADGNGCGIKAAVDDQIKSDITLYAGWQAAILTFKNQFEKDSSITIYTGKTLTTEQIPQVSKDGYSFNGWFDAETQLVAGYCVTMNKTFTAQWTPNEYKVTFNSNGGSGTMEQQSFTFAAEKTLTANVFTRTGYTFQGWATDANSDVVTYTDSQAFQTPSRNTTLYAVWKANEYTITFYSNNGSDNSATQTVTFGKTEKLNSNTFTWHGYRFVAWNTEQDATGISYSNEVEYTVTQTGNITLYAQWVESDKWVISYQNTKGAVNSSPLSYRSSVGITLCAPVLTGWVFEGWYDSQDENGNGSGNLVQGWGANEKDCDVTLYAQWTPRTDTVYKVEHYKQNADNDAYTLAETEDKTGTTEAQTDAKAKTYEHFTAGTVTQSAIAADGTTVIRIDYTRNNVEMKFILDGGKIEGKTEYTIIGKYDSSYSVNAPEKTGWNFAGWSPALPVKMAAGTYTATYTPRTDTVYKVTHYKQNADDDSYTLAETEDKTGTTDAQTDAKAKTYEHFTAGTVTQSTIAADGTTVVRIDYTRETITFILDPAGGTLNGQSQAVTKTGRWGQTVEAVTAPVRAGYSFEGWNTAGGAIAQTFDENTTYTAKWSTAKGITITVQTADINVTKTQDGNIITFTAEDCDSYSWFLDNVSKGSEKSLQIDVASLAKGTYTVALEAQQDTRWYSYYAQIKVGE